MRGGDPFMKNVYAVYTPEDAPLAVVWVRGWAARGWLPQLLSPRDIRRAGGDVLKALRKRGKGELSLMRCINFSFQPGDKAEPVPYLGEGWMDAALVLFPREATSETVLNCGRRIC